MTRPLLAIATLWLFAFMLVAPSVSAVTVTAEPTAGHARHADGSSCPDGDQHGPCDDGCACHCCHGHLLALCVPLPDEAEALLPPSLLPTLGPAQSLHPNNHCNRIFRPPRG